MTILTIEHERTMGGYLRHGLTENGYVVDLARDCVDGQHLALTGDPLCQTSCRLQILDFFNRDAVIANCRSSGKCSDSNCQINSNLLPIILSRRGVTR